MRSKIIVLLLTFFTAAQIVVAESVARVGAGAGGAESTPELAVGTWVTGKGYGAVLDPLHVQALVLEQDDTKAALLRYDLAGITESLRDEVRKAVGAALAIPGEN